MKNNEPPKQFKRFWNRQQILDEMDRCNVEADLRKKEGLEWDDKANKARDGGVNGETIKMFRDKATRCFKNEKAWREGYMNTLKAKLAEMDTLPLFESSFVKGGLEFKTVSKGR